MTVTALQPIAFVKPCPFCRQPLLFRREQLATELHPRQCDECGKTFFVSAGRSAGALTILTPGRDCQKMIQTSPSQALLPCPFCLQPAAQAIATVRSSPEIYFTGCFNPKCRVKPIADSTCEGESCFKWNCREVEVGR